MDVTEPAAEAGIHRQVRDLADRAVAWLALREDGDVGVGGVVVELSERRTFEGRAGQSLLVRCERLLFRDELPGELRLKLDADDDGVVSHAHAEIAVSGRRKALRQVIDRLPKLPGSTRRGRAGARPAAAEARAVAARGHARVPAGDAIEDLITRGLAALDTLADESVSRDKKSRKRR